MSRSHRTARLLSCLALAIAFTLGAGPPAPAAECANADVAPTADNLDDVRGAILCLTNVERRSRHLQPLRENAKLRKAAGSHSADMVRNGFFAHTAPDGDTFVDRVVKARYVLRNDAWTLGENLAWGTGDLSTARGVHDAWMKSAGHKANILRKAYRELGIGIRLGVPADGAVGATFTNDFGGKT
jgi:uncharacterized protein YkwD